MTEEVAFAPVNEFLGWKVADDKSHVLLRFKQPNGTEFVLGVPPDALDQAIIHLVNATAAFPIPKGLGERRSYAMGVDSIDVGHTPSTGNFYLRMRFPAGGHLGFNLNRALAELMHESLGNELGIGPQSAPPGAARN
jgi:hypothetical protein